MQLINKTDDLIRSHFLQIKKNKIANEAIWVNNRSDASGRTKNSSIRIEEILRFQLKEHWIRS